MEAKPESAAWTFPGDEMSMHEIRLLYIFTWNPSWHGEDEYEELRHVSLSVCVYRNTPNSVVISFPLVM